MRKETYSKIENYMLEMMTDAAPEEIGEEEAVVEEQLLIGSYCFVQKI